MTTSTKKNATHTQGPWTYTPTAPTAGPVGYAIIGGGPEPETLGKVWNTRHEKAIANARLIAAAPEMRDYCDSAASALEIAAEDIADYVDTGIADDFRRRAAVIRALLARIDGREP